MNVKYYKKYVEKLINADPTDITIKRKTSTSDGYGGKIKTEETLDPQTVRIYNKKAQRELVNDSGIVTAYYTSSMHKILAKTDADLKEGDTFAYQGKTFEITFLRSFEGICLQGELGIIK